MGSGEGHDQRGESAKEVGMKRCRMINGERELEMAKLKEKFSKVEEHLQRQTKQLQATLMQNLKSGVYVGKRIQWPARRLHARN